MITTLALMTSLALSASDAAHDKFYADEQAVDDAVKDLVAGGQFGDAAAKCKAFTTAHKSGVLPT